MPTSREVFDFLKDVQPMGTWSLVIIGWLFVRRDNNKREDRRERRSALDTIIKEIKSLEEKAYDYYKTAATDPDVGLMEIAMKRDRDTISARIERLHKASGGFDDRLKFKNFDEALTGGDFEGASRLARTPKDRKMLEVSIATNDLIEYLETEYVRLFPPMVVSKTRFNFFR